MAIMDDYERIANAVILRVYSNRMELLDPKRQLQFSQLATQDYANQRTLIADYNVAEQIALALIQQLPKQLGFLPATPIVLLQAMELCDDGLTQVEARALREMALSAGARDCKVYEPNQELSNADNTSGSTNDVLPKQQISKPFIIIFLIIGFLIAALLVFLLVVQ